MCSLVYTEVETNLAWEAHVEFLPSDGDRFALLHLQSLVLSVVINGTHLRGDSLESTCGHGTEQSQLAHVGIELMMWN